MKKTDLIALRDYLPTDEAFIFSTWLTGLRYGNKFYELIDQEAYFQNYRRVISALLKKSKTIIACLKDDPDNIVGYSVSSPSTLHWIHVKKDWRNIGIAKDLIPDSLDSVSHLTRIAIEILKKHPEIKFNPFL